VLSSRLMKRFFLAQLIGVIALQIFVLPSAADGIELCLPILLVGLGIVATIAKITVQPLRLLFLAIFLVVALISQIVGGVPFSGPSIFLLIALYLPMCFTLNITRQDYLLALNMFQNAMLIVFAVVLLQHLIQIIFSWRVWPNLMELTPDAFHLHHFNYLQPLKYGSKFYKPQGLVFLEVSFLSQFTALAFIIEFTVFRRPWQLAAYLTLLLISFAGTGLLMLMICGPLLLIRSGPKVALGAAVVGLLVVAVAVASGWFAQIEGRIFEFQTEGTSGYARFVYPMLTLMDLASDPSTLIKGYGAGSFPPGENIAMPFMKVAFEYGMLPMLTFMIFLIYSMFNTAPSRRIAFGCLIYFLYGGGGLLLPVYVVPCILFATLFRIVPDEMQTAPLRRVGLAKTAAVAL